MMKRREFMALIGGAAAAWPIAARAQEPNKLVRIGFLGPAQTSPPSIAFYNAFLSQMRENGFRDGQNLRMEFRAIEDPRGLSASAQELVRSQPVLIVATGPEVSLRAVSEASPTIPIVMVAINFDPIARGYVASLARPGGRITGVVSQQLGLARKQIELLSQALPGKAPVAILFDRSQAGDQLGAAEGAARSLNLQAFSIGVEGPSYNFEAAFSSAASKRAEMMLILSGSGFAQHASRIADLAIQRRLPTMFIAKLYVDAGGLMSYGVEFASMFGRAADYVSKIINGAKPADLPVEQASKFQMVLNLKRQGDWVRASDFDPPARRRGDRISAPA